MKIVFIRHGEPDKSLVDNRGFIGQGGDFAPKRSQPVMDKYYDLGYAKIIVVAHGGIIRRYTGVGLIPHCDVSQIQYDKTFKCYDWVRFNVNT